MADSKPAEKAAEAVDQAAEAQQVDGVTAVADVDKRPAKTRAYRSDRNLAEVSAGEVFYLDPASETGKRLLATGYLEEVEDPLA